MDQACVLYHNDAYEQAANRTQTCTEHLIKRVLDNSLHDCSDEFVAMQQRLV